MGFWDPMPPVRPELPTRRELFIDIEVLGGVRVGGDIISANWDGAIPLALSSADSGATAGYGLDASAGAGQFMSIFAEGGQIGNLDIVGNLTFDTGGVFRSDSTGSRIEMSAANDTRISFITAHADEITAPSAVSGIDATKASNRIAVILDAGRMDSGDTSLRQIQMISRNKGETLNGGLDVFTDEIDLVYDATTDAPEDAFWQVRKGSTVVIKADDNGLVTVPGLTWKTWTPTWTNLTIGNAVVVARYTQIGDTVIAYLSAVLGNTSSVDSTPVSVSLPVTEATSYSDGGSDPIGLAYFIDATSSDFNGRVALFNDKVVLQVFNASATSSTNTNLNTTVPFTWTTSDEIRTHFTYEAA